LAVGASVALGSGVIAGALLSKKLSAQKHKVTPTKWVRVGSVKELILYPVKSCQGIHVNEAETTIIGLKCM
jgi:hypothetical protein